MRIVSVMLLLGGCLGASACGSATGHPPAAVHSGERSAEMSEGHSEHRQAGVHDHTTAPAQSAASAAMMDPGQLGQAIERVRRATAAFRDLDEAVKAGYPATVAQCISHPRAGAMGFHHMNRALLDARIEPERPEILLYSREPDGRYVLNGVEYIVPYSVHAPDAQPPRVFGQPLRRSDELRIWYLHVWIWRDNPTGLFADWNPAVSCSTAAALMGRRLPRGFATDIRPTYHHRMPGRHV